MEFWNAPDHLNDPRTIAIGQHAELRSEISKLLARIQYDPTTNTEIQDGLRALLHRSTALDQTLKLFVPGPYYNHASSLRSYALAAKAFGIVELLEMILGHLDQASLSNAQAVCRAWEDIIEGSAPLSQDRYRLFHAPPKIFRTIPTTHTPKEFSTSIRFHAHKMHSKPGPKSLQLQWTSIIAQLTDENHLVPRSLNAACRDILISENPVVKSMRIWQSCTRSRHEIIPANTYFPEFCTVGDEPPEEITASSSVLTTSSPWASSTLQCILHGPGLWAPHMLTCEDTMKPMKLRGQRLGYILKRDTVLNDGGLALGDLYDVASKISATHDHCPYQAEHEYDPATGNVMMDFQFIGLINLENRLWVSQMKWKWDAENKRAYGTASEDNGK
ncbi:uncharacterized protein RHO25_013046 [Cercospora beticola]|uniref:F-box domain-containing protein n=1 Tax=Cercospora beticola TaxID=122368 RepID=A0ABZ0P997_CERBT|nr:hypothetical protein RHO25_013046 [Cercospora beticola]